MTGRPQRLRMLIVTYTPIDREPRALKQIRYFSDKYDVTTAGFGPSPVENVPHIVLEESPPPKGLTAVKGLYTFLLVFRMYRLFNKYNARNQAAFERLSQERWDVVIAHDVKTMSLALKLNPRNGVLADLHEYAPRQNEHSFLWRLLIAPYFRWECRAEVARAAAVTTVGQGIVDEYRRQFGFTAHLVVNATPYQDLKPAPVARPIRLVHSGIPAPARKLEVMIEAVRQTTTEVALDLYLIQDGSEYYDKLVELANGDPRIAFREPVAYAELVSTLNAYDVGLSVIAPTTFNLAWCLPNKFFDFIQARLGVIVGPSPEMTRFVDEFGIGAIAEDFSAEALAAVLNNLTLDVVEQWKRQSAAHARELSSEEQVKVWGAVVAGMVAGA